MGAQVRGRKTDLPAEFVTAGNGPQNGVRAAQHLLCPVEIPELDSLSNSRAAHHQAVHCHWVYPDDLEIKSRAELLEQLKIAGAIAAKRPFMADTNFPERIGMGSQGGDELLRRCLRKVAVE